MKDQSIGKLLVSSLLILLLSVFTVTSVLSAGHSFSDVNDQTRAKEEIEYLVNEGVINGYRDGTFRPDINISRGQVALIIARSLGLIELDGTIVSDNLGSGFTDVSESSTFYPALITLQGEGIIRGYTGGQFRPDQSITRGEIAIILANAYGLERSSETLSFSDQNPTFNDAIQALYDNGITDGMTETTFGTSANLTRGDFSIFVFRVLTMPDPITVESLEFNEAGDQFDITFSGLPDGADPANLDQDEIVALLDALDLLDTVLIELNGDDVTDVVLPDLNLSTGSDPLDGLTLTVDHANLNDLDATEAGDEVTLTIGDASDTYTILPDPITVESIAFNEAGDQFDITFSGLPDGADPANLDQDEIVALLDALDLLDTVLIELNGDDVTDVVLPDLNLSTGSDPLDGLTLTVDHANLNDLDLDPGDEVTLTIGGASDTYTIANEIVILG